MTSIPGPSPPVPRPSILALLLGMEQLRDQIEDERRLAVGTFFVDALRPQD
ncbi:MAG: hypothetical protein U5R31_02300 [Acidimicrobiia bacterium]|nr:hypothetical protein [Acidimicrobiia bacterium]